MDILLLLFGITVLLYAASLIEERISRFEELQRLAREASEEDEQ